MNYRLAPSHICEEFIKIIPVFFFLFLHVAEQLLHTFNGVQRSSFKVIQVLSMAKFSINYFKSYHSILLSGISTLITHNPLEKSFLNLYIFIFQKEYCFLTI